MSTDTQLDNAAIAHDKEVDRLLDFVVWLFDDATKKGVSTLDDHRNLISKYIEERGA